jgi:Domain of Unknown Function (DUF1080)
MSRWMRLVVCSALLAGCGMDTSEEPAPGATMTPVPSTPPARPNPTVDPPAPPSNPVTAPPAPAPGTVTPPPPPEGTPPATPPVAMPPANPAPTTPPLPGDAPYGCARCTRLFNGVDLENWETNPGAWVVKDGVLASTGKSPGELYTKEDLGDYRIFFQVRHVGVMGGKDHKPCTTFFGKRPADPSSARSGISGAQFQPPNGSSWDYGAKGAFTHPPHPSFDAKQWHQCEVLVREAGSFRAACCPMGDTACKTVDVLSWKGTGRKHPFNIQIHNAGLLDEYKELWIEKDPIGDELLSQK